MNKKIMFLCALLALFTTLFSPNNFAEQQENIKPTFALTYNVAETLAFGISNAVLKVPVTLIPIHLDAHFHINDNLGISLGLVYRYEDYGKTSTKSFGDPQIARSEIWTNFHEIFLLAGPRFAPFHTGLEGFYVSLLAGVGMAASPLYASFNVLVQPEIGYTFALSKPGFCLSLGAGLLVNMPVVESTPVFSFWNFDYNISNPALAVVVHQLIPIIQVGLGFAL